jgi:DNA repair exonuclease SbcCD ATPase subunit|mmetsp:Transcript_44204/g.68892  ORF Transcript_44204/g.68892 Transcript_44204/m.68892 type:complete len:717 (-) Transcript_44204:54-2204(-)
MAPTTITIFFLAMASGAAAAKQGAELTMTANPIRKVVNMLQAMQKKVAAEGDKEEELFEKFMCYCKNGASALEKSIADAEAKAPELVSEIEASEGQVKQLKEDLKQHQADRTAAKKAMAEATAVREKEAAAFAAEKSEADANIAAAAGAITAISKGMEGSFLQTSAGQRLQQMVLAQNDMSDYDREELTAFLSNKEGYAPASGEIVGILKQMKETMEKSLAEITEAEEAAIKSYDGLMAAKTKEVAALTKTIEEKMVRLGDLKVAIVEMKEDLDDTGKALLEDKKFLADLSTNCKTKEAEHDENVKLRSQELVALADTIKVLNDDDALELFKKTLPSGASSFLQLKVTAAEQRRRALAAIKAVSRKGHPELNFIALAIQGKKVSFEKVIGMIDEMVAVLAKEQTDDTHKKEYCEKQFDQADDKKKGLERDISKLSTAIDKEKELIAQLTDEIKALEEGIVALDKSVAEATEQRKEENSEYTELMASDGAAKELLGFAKNRLNKFYNPKLYKPPPKRELSEEDRITVNMGGTLAPTAAPAGIAGTGITVMAEISSHVAPPPPPETAAAYAKKSEDSNGVISMIDLLIADLSKEMTEAKTTEKLAQEEYEKFMKDSAEKRALDSQALADKSKAKAEAEADLDSYKEEKVGTTKTLMATEKYIANLHGECDWLLQYFEVRKEARAGEVESLKTAKAVLSGADYSFVEVGTAHRRLRGGI